MASVLTTLRGLFVQKDASNTNTSPRIARLALGSWLGRSSTGATRTGVMIDNMGPVVTGTAATGPMTVSVRACTIVSQFAAADGVTDSPLDTAVTVPVDAAPDTNSRIDLVWARQNRLATSDGGAGTNNQLEIGVTAGEVSGSPSPPDPPQGAIALATFTVANGTTSTAALSFTQAHAWVPANGGIVPTSKGSRLGKAWDGNRDATVPLGLIIAGQSSTIQANAFFQMGRYTGSTDANSHITVPLPQPFPNGVLGVLPGNSWGNVIEYHWFDSTENTLSFLVNREDNGGPWPNQAVNLSWLAWGH